ncbi:TetR family transcriptional regulator [Mycobacterium colombiense]|uniref:TetR/AcrR family transcriptional regulator n=1 Tax=Mycobacterium colombiense TaxID=339268 RepID=UPI0007EF85D1|nr:TetR/AcrR family transcriptional regulator [Mycobacterium colombiense]OBK63212.1 TetR family transcriptional regulator [Mycobacterium colombiense]
MSAPRRHRGGNTDTRDRLIAATEEIMLEEGYAAATSRRIAAKSGVNPALVHYYFPTLIDLFVAVFRRGAEANLTRQREALACESSLHKLWELAIEPRGTALFLEFMALGNHRKEIRSEIAGYIERFREGQLAALTLILHRRGIDVEALPPAVISILITSAGRTITMESDMDVTSGHQELHAFIGDFLRFAEGQPWQRQFIRPPERTQQQ